MKDKTPKLNFDYQSFGFPASAVWINELIWYVDCDGYRVVSQGWNTPLYRFSIDNKVEYRFVAVSLRLNGCVRQYEIAKAFGHSVESQRGWEKRYLCDGITGLQPKKASGRPRKISSGHNTHIRKWFKKGVSNYEMGRRLGVAEGTIRLALSRMGLSRKVEVPEPPKLFVEDVDEEATAATESEEVGENDQKGDKDDALENRDSNSSDMDSERETDFENLIEDPMDRSPDRALAALGLLNDADPAFAEIDRLPRAGVLFIIPLLIQSGTLDVFQRIYGSIGPAFYGLRTTVVCLFFLAFLRIKRPENLKEYSPQEIGRLLGLDRAPEVKTLRRKFGRLANFHKGMDLMRALAELRIQKESEALGILYFDGHVKEYHGKYKTGKAFVSRRRLAAPGATDTWVNDLNGDPFFVVQSEMNEGLTKTLEPILTEIRELMGPDRDITVVFDRGGWSPKLFSKLIQSGYHIITYRRGHISKLSRSSFEERTLAEGKKTFTYKLHDAPRVRIGKTGNKKGEGPKYLWMRQVTRLRDGKHQTAVITDRSDLPAEKILYLMFNRWRQENYFKYMKEEFGLDALLEYGCESVSETHDRPNPEVKKIEKQLSRARADLKEAQRALGQLLKENQESSRRTVRGFKIANSKALKRIEEAMEKVEMFKEKKAALPKRISAEGVVKLKRERNLIADAIKMSAYLIESQLAAMLEGSYARNADEGRTLLHTLFQSSGRIEVEKDELRVTLVTQSSPHKTRVVAELCKELNQLGAKFPGTNLRLILAVDTLEPVIF